MFLAKVHILLTKTRQVILVLTVNPTPWLTPTLDYHFVRIHHVLTTLFVYHIVITKKELSMENNLSTSSNSLGVGVF